MVFRILPILLLLFLILGTPRYLFPIYAESATESSAPPRNKLESVIEKKQAKVGEQVKRRLDVLEQKVQGKKERLEMTLDERKEKLASQEAELKDKLRKFRDKKKADLTLKVNDNLVKINEQRVAQMLKHLDKMSEVLSRVEEVVGKGSLANANLSQATSAIIDAKAAITVAKTAVQSQANKSYTIEVTTEGKVGEVARASRSSLHTDLKATQDLVVKARKAVANAVSTSRRLLGGDENGK